MISKATLRYIRISPRKVRPVIALVKGKKAQDAISTLYSVKRKASALLIDVINSAVANAKRIMPGIDVSDLYVSSLIANGGPQLKRFRAASMGRATTIRKRTSHITVELDTNLKKDPQDSGSSAISESKKTKNIGDSTKVSPKENQTVKKSKKTEHIKKGKE